MKNLILIAFFLFTLVTSAQYTDVINSNRPGQSVSAYAVGKNVIQAEFGIGFEHQEHTILLTDSNILSTDLALRYGLLFESLEIYYEGSFQKENINYSSSQANHKFRLKNLIPAVSVYAGATFVLGDNPYYLGDATVSPRVMIATQSKISPRVVFISNIAYDRIGTDFPELSYIVSLTHAFRNPKWSIFLENQGIKSDRYADALYRTGLAHLLTPNLQADITFGGSFKDTPTRMFGTLGVSYRLDKHKDNPIPIDQQKGGENGQIGKKDMKKKAKKTKKGKGAEDIDLGPSKKQLKKLKKEEKKKQGNGAIDF